MGASLEDAQAAMRTLASSRATKTHPARNDRLNSIAEGWNDADMNTSSEVYVKNEPIVEKRLPAINLNDILADISFHADPDADYHVTRRLNVIKVENNQLVRIGKLTKLNNSRYPYMIYDEKNNRVYIDNSGRIVNRRGELVGMMNSHH